MSLRLFSFPAQSKNPYLKLFYEALEPYGVEHADGFTFSPRWVETELGEGDVLHFHWPEILWTSEKWTEGRPKLLVLFKLRRMLQAAQRRGVRVIWTVHNFDLFEEDGWLDRLGQQITARHSDLLIVHRATMVEWVKDRFKSEASIVVMPHGNYKGYYPAPRPRAEVMRDLGIDEDKTLLCCLGRIRDYKALDVACEALARLDDDIALVIAGKPHPGYDVDMLEAYAAKLPGLTLMTRLISDQEMVDILAASEATLLPYRQITGSGTLLMAWSHGCGVVASDLTFFREIIPEASAAGLHFETDDPEALAQAVRTYLERPRNERREAASAEAAKYDWDKCVIALGTILQAWQGIAPAARPPHAPQMTP